MYWRQRTKIAHASSEYRKVKCVRDNVLFWYIFMDVLFHRFLKHFWKIFDLVHCHVFFEYISFAFNRFLSWSTILCKIFWEKLRNKANLYYTENFLDQLLCVSWVPVPIIQSCSGNWTLIFHNCRLIVYNFFYIPYQVLFYLRWMGSVLKRCKISNYYEQDRVSKWVFRNLSNIYNGGFCENRQWLLAVN